MNHAQATEEISTALGVLTHQVAQENLAGLFSKNRLVEDIFLPVFRVLFSAPELQNLNSVGSNHAYLDLGDIVARLGIQVSTDGSAAKIKETLKGIVDDGLAEDYHRIVIFVLAAKRTRYTTASKRAWASLCAPKLNFDPRRDVVELPSLLARINGLHFSDILAIRSSIARSVIGAEYVDVSALVSAVSEKHLAYEKKTARYIPGVFIETRDTKQLCRCFCHPALFLRRSIESAQRLDLERWNDFLERAGMEPLAIPTPTDICPESMLIEVERKAEMLWESYQPLLRTIKEYKRNGSRRLPLPQATPKQLAFYEQNQHVLGNNLQFVPSTIADARDEFNSASKRIFLLTGAAGQGKTNLLCDLYENFIVKHGIPCAFLSGRELGLKANGDLAQVLCSHLFGSKISTLDQGAELLSKEALGSNKPFVLIIDGLNEHQDSGLFSQQLEYLVDSLLAYPGLRFLLSCRTEFFQDRFSNLTSGTLGSHTMLYRSTDTQLADAERDELLFIYFQYFEIDGDRVAPHVQKILTRDLLLLRIFCETYGRRGQDESYQQPDIQNLYRDELFDRYVNRKLYTAALFLQSLTTAPSPTSPRRQLKKVLHLCLKHMLGSNQFLGVPFTVIPEDLRPALYALLDEELIIRKDPSVEGGNPFSEAVNFTFDELRDYLAAQYLIGTVYPVGFEAFVAAIDALKPQNAPTEGVQRFLFYASRKPSNAQFYRHYRGHRWYADVYDREVFNVDQSNLGPEDVAEVESRLQRLDGQACEIARRLAVVWDPTAWPVLNLSILNGFVISEGPKAYDVLIADSLGCDRYGRTSFCEAICSFAGGLAVSEPIQAEFSRFREVIRLLILMLPVRADSWWSSPSADALRLLIKPAIREVTEVILSFPAEVFPSHRRMLWRLLYDSMNSKADPRILKRAEAEYLAAASDDPDLLLELERFLERFRGERK